MKKIYLFITLMILITVTLISQEVFTDNFSDGDYSGWTFWADSDEFDIYVENEELRIGHEYEDDGMGFFTPLGAVINFSYELSVKAEEGLFPEYFNLFCMSHEGNYINFAINEGDTAMLLLGKTEYEEEEENEDSVLYREAIDPVGTGWHTMKLEVITGDASISLEIFWDDVSLFSTEISDIPELADYGHLGIYLGENEFDITIDDVEKKTGINFFASLPADIENKLESDTNFRNWQTGLRKQNVTPIHRNKLPKNCINTVQAI